MFAIMLSLRRVVLCLDYVWAMFGLCLSYFWAALSHGANKTKREHAFTCSLFHFVVKVETLIRFTQRYRRLHSAILTLLERLHQQPLMALVEAAAQLF